MEINIYIYIYIYICIYIYEKPKHEDWFLFAKYEYVSDLT